MKRIAIVGGGISGLAAAFALEERRQAGDALDYTVYESGPRFGGVLATEQVDGCLVEAGPDSFLTEKPWAADLCRRLGIADQLIGSSDGDRKTYILVKGKLIPLPDGLMFMVPTRLAPSLLSPLFSSATKFRMVREWRMAPRQAENDESVAALVDRHYGAEMVDRLADPLLSGVYGGEASQLSVRAVLPRFVEMESKYGSLGRGMLAARKNLKSAPSRTPIFTSLKNGMQELSDALAARVSPQALRANTLVEAVQQQERGWVISAGYASDTFDAVIVATSAPAAGLLLDITCPNLASELKAIPYSSSMTVALGFGKDIRAALPPGFGFLVPRSEGKRMLAATFVHNKFPHRAPPDRALLRCFLGGSRDGQILQLPDDEILTIVREELGQILNLKAEPLFTRVYRWKKAMAQYTVGHLERLRRIEGLLKQAPGLALAGNAYRGIGVPDCVHSGEIAAQQVLAG
ncbi:MAG TPA: protoporphyrinogen oxidase [Terriglobales bacterium]|nr:protoporphyrinogen oxidase [Terriglobales bacterium]